MINHHVVGLPLANLIHFGLAGVDNFPDFQHFSNMAILLVMSFDKRSYNLHTAAHWWHDDVLLISAELLQLTSMLLSPWRCFSESPKHWTQYWHCSSSPSISGMCTSGSGVVTSFLLSLLGMLRMGTWPRTAGRLAAGGAMLTVIIQIP